MTREETVAFFKAREDPWRRRDPAALAASHSEDCVVVSPIFKTVHGRTAIEESYRSLFRMFPDWTFTSDDLVIDGDRAAQVFSVSATHLHEFLGMPPTNRRFEIHGVLLFRFDGGLIAQENRTYDFTGLLVQLGVIKARPART